MNIEKILYATDLSNASSRALPEAIWLARDYNAELHVVHVAERLVDVIPMPGGMPPMELESDEELDRRARRQLHAWLGDRLPEGVDVRVEVIEGDVVKELIRYAATKDVDIIVLGTHGRSAVERFFLGSVTEAVIRKTPCAVLTVPTRAGKGTISKAE